MAWVRLGGREDMGKTDKEAMKIEAQVTVVGDVVFVVMVRE